MRRGSGGANPSAGASKGLQCTVLLLDGSDMKLEVANKKAPSQNVFELVFQQLGIVDKEYFGFVFEDSSKNMVWVDLQKPLKKQLRKFPCKVHFKVKYYPLDPMVPHPSCRNLFYQQIKRDMIGGSMKIPSQTSPCILSYMLQADLGDFESSYKDMNYILDQKLLLDEQSPGLRDEIAQFHQLYNGMGADEAVAGFLRKVRDLDTYGIQLYNVRYEEICCELGVSPGGMSIFRNNLRVIFHDWSTVAEVSFKNKKFLVTVSGLGFQDIVLTLEMESLKISKEVWKSSADFASFYSEPSRRRRESLEAILSLDGTKVTPSSCYPQPCSPLIPSEIIDSVHLKRDRANTDSMLAAAMAVKTRSLPHFLPGEDPIAAALMLNRSRRGGNSCGTPSVEDFVMTSPSENMSPLTPLSPALSGSQEACDLILPGMPNLQDEEGRPLNYPRKQQQQQTSNFASPLEKAAPKHGGAQVSPGGNRLSDPSDWMGKRNSGEAGPEHAPPPLLPPRNYHSQYRCMFHPRENGDAAAEADDSCQYFPGDSSQKYRAEHEQDASLVSRSNSTTTNQSLLDLADELGGRLSAVSLHSGAGWKSRDGSRWQEVGRGEGAEGGGGVAKGGETGAEGGGRGKGSVQATHNNSRYTSSFHDLRQDSATPTEHPPNISQIAGSSKGATLQPLDLNGCGQGLVQKRQANSSQQPESSSNHGHHSASQPHHQHHSHHSHPHLSPDSPPFRNNGIRQQSPCGAGQEQGPRSLNAEGERDQDWERERKKAREVEMEMKRERENERQRERTRGQDRERGQDRDRMRGQDRERMRGQDRERREERDETVEQERKLEQMEEKGYEAAMVSQMDETERRLERLNMLFSAAGNATGYGQSSHLNDRNKPHQIQPHVVASTGSCDQDSQPLYDFSNPGIDDCPLPDSPAPPPYQSPSPDSEQAKFLRQRGHFPIPPPASHFAYHPSMLGVIADVGMELSEGDSENQSSSHSGAQQLHSLQFHSRTSRMGSHSPQPLSQSPPEAGVSLSNSSANWEGLVSVSSRKQREESTNLEQPQMQPQSQLHARRKVDSSSIAQLPHIAGISQHSTESQTHATSMSVEISSPLSPDQLRELDELIGGVQAMVTEVNSHNIEEFGIDSQEMEAGGGGRSEGRVEEEAVVLDPLPNLENVDRRDLAQEVTENSKVSPVDRAEHKSRGMEKILREQLKALQLVPPKEEGGKGQGEERHRATSTGSNPQLQGYLMKKIKEEGGKGQGEERHRATSTGSNPQLQGYLMKKIKQVKPERQAEAVASDASVDKCGSKRDLHKADLASGVDLDPQTTPQSAKPNVRGLSEDVLSPTTTVLHPTHLASDGGSTNEKEESLGQILQEVMSSDDLPPPPAHLMALSHELQFQGLPDNNSPASNAAAFSAAPSKHTTMATTSKTYSDSNLAHPGEEGLRQVTLTSTATANTDGGAEVMQPEKYGLKYFPQKRIDPLPHATMAEGSTNSSQLPPAIVNFMNRVQNSSSDGADSHGPQSFSPITSSSKTELKESPHNGQEDAAAARSDETSQKDSTYESHCAVEVSKFVLQSSSYPSKQKDAQELSGAKVAAERCGPTNDVDNSTSISSAGPLSPCNAASGTEPELVPQQVKSEGSRMQLESHSLNKMVECNPSLADAESPRKLPSSGGPQRAERSGIHRDRSVSEGQNQRDGAGLTCTLSDFVPPDCPQEAEGATFINQNVQSIQKHKQHPTQQQSGRGTRKNIDLKLSSRSSNLKIQQQHGQQYWQQQGQQQHQHSLGQHQYDQGLQQHGKQQQYDQGQRQHGKQQYWQQQQGQGQPHGKQQQYDQGQQPHGKQQQYDQGQQPHGKQQQYDQGQQPHGKQQYWQQQQGQGQQQYDQGQQWQQKHGRRQHGQQLQLQLHGQGQQQDGQWQQQHRQQRMKLMADIKRAKNLSGSLQVNSKPPPVRTFPTHPTGHEDSLPSSPTYFAEAAQQQERATPSPNTQLANKTFQLHLDSLSGKSKMQKMRVLDWIHQANPEPQEPGKTRTKERGERKEEKSARTDQRGPKMSERAPRMDKSGLSMEARGANMDERGVNMDERGVNVDEGGVNVDDRGQRAAEKKQNQERMKLDYSAELHSMSSQKKAPSMDCPGSSVPLLESHSASYAPGIRPSQDRNTSGMMVKMDARNGEEQRFRVRPRVQTDSFVSHGPWRQNHQQGSVPVSRGRAGSEKQVRSRNTLPNTPESGFQGRTGSVRSGARAQQSTVHPPADSVQVNYPTARIEKDYYIIDV